MHIQIYKGYVSHYQEGSSDIQTGTLTITFCVGDPPIKFYSLFMSGKGPLAYGGYVAVAGIPSLVPSFGNVALAYRRLGGAESAHAFNIIMPVMCIICSIIFGLLGLTFKKIDTSDQLFMMALIALGMFGIWRIWSIRKALHMLNQLHDISPRGTGK